MEMLGELLEGTQLFALELKTMPCVFQEDTVDLANMNTDSPVDSPDD